MSDELIRRLRRTVTSAPDINGGRRQVPLNPDGPEAAALIIKLTCERAAFAHLSQSRGKLLLAETARADTAERKVEKLREALKPFTSNEWSKDWLDASCVTIDVALGAIRRAKKALKETESEQ